MFKSAIECIDYARTNEIGYFNFLHIDILGRVRVTTKPAHAVNVNTLEFGIYIDLSSDVSGTFADSARMTLKPDITTAFNDPYSAYPAMAIICDSAHSESGDKCTLGSRFTASKAMSVVQKQNVADVIDTDMFVQFHIFDGMRCSVDLHDVSHHISQDEGNKAFSTSKEYGNLGHRPHDNGGCYAQQPIDSFFDLRTELVESMRKLAIGVTGHHHGTAMGQCQVDFSTTGLLNACDDIIKTKYITRSAVASYGKTATFMPAPFGQSVSGSGMTLGIALHKNGKNVLAGNGYGQMSEVGEYFIGGLIKHMGAVAAFTNATTNSYKRFHQGRMINDRSSLCNSNTAILVPYSKDDDSVRIYCQFPDPSSNAYLAYSAIMAAGIDGVINHINPPPHESGRNHNLFPASLANALDSLESDSAFLTGGGLFTDDQISRYVKFKRHDLERLENIPHPWEFFQYYSY